jgi:hypothetical protein
MHNETYLRRKQSSVLCDKYHWKKHKCDSEETSADLGFFLWNEVSECTLQDAVVNNDIDQGNDII